MISWRGVTSREQAMNKGRPRERPTTYRLNFWLDSGNAF